MSATGRRYTLAAANAAIYLIFATARVTHAQDMATASKVLQRFQGAWHTKTQIRHAGPPVREFNTLGKAICVTSLEGRFFEFRTKSIPPRDADLQVMTYDAKANVYRQWVFASDGYTHAAEGIWDPNTSILRWTGKSGNDSFVIDDHWISPDRLEWTLRRVDSHGHVLQTIAGTVTREETP